MRIRDFEALTFDCYGTLIDWETGILNQLCPWAEANKLSVSRGELLEAFAQAESKCEQATPSAAYPDILRDVHGEIAARFGVAPEAKYADQLADSVGDWPVFADTVQSLKRLHEHHRLVIISNVDRDSFARTNEKLETRFDAIITAQDVGVYKPDRRMFDRALATLETMGIGRDNVLHVAQSLYHDHVPAKALGLRTAWVDRRRGQSGTGATVTPPSAVTPDLVVASLAELADLDAES